MLQGNPLSNVVDLAEFRKKQKPTIRPLMAFEPGQYYIYPELGIMVHCLFITDKSITHKNQPIYVMEDQYGNIFSVPINDPENMMGWRLLEKQVFIEIVKKGLPEPEPPRVS